jgi:hypothetical protein
MATTTNFGWETPDDTDLVKDGALAMRTLGNAIDTSLVDLKGGTTGQVLSKTSNTDMDFTWINNDQGDITAVTAGTGISGGGTSGAVTITNSMATEITAAGDIIIGTGSGTFDNLPIGTTGQILTADTTVSPYKVKWATAASSSPTFVGVRATATTNQTLSNATSVTINFNNETIDSDGFHDNSTNNSRLTVPTGKGGKYLVSGTMIFQGNASGIRIIQIAKNGTVYGETYALGYNSSQSMNAQMILDASAGDYFTLKLYQNTGGNLDTLGANEYCYFEAYLIGA